MRGGLERMRGGPGGMRRTKQQRNEAHPEKIWPARLNLRQLESFAAVLGGFHSSLLHAGLVFGR